MPLKCCFAASKIVRKYRSLERILTAQQILNNAVRLLLQCGLYTRDFEDWDRKIAADKIWTNLKTFVQECYMRCLNSTSITAGSQGYIQNAFAALGEESDEEDDDCKLSSHRWPR
jgi:hypothetical protein